MGSTSRVPDKFHSLIRCSQLLIRFEFGVLKVTADLSQNPRPDSYSIKDATVYFSDDDSTQWSRGRHGTMDGNTFLLSTCVVRSILASIAQPQTDPFTRLPKAITWSLILSALHQERGYGSAKALHSPDNYVPPYISLLSEAEKNRDRTSEEAEGDPEALHFVTSPSCPVRIGKLSVPEPVLEMLALCTKDDDQAERSTLSTWSRVPHFNTNHHPYNGDPATAVATLGIEAMAYFEQGAGQRREPSLAWPYAEFGNIVAVVREEIDGLIACKEQLISYLYSKRLDEKPLALGVFGPPGSGKNFTVRQLLKSIDKRLSTESTVYNLSQFRSKTQLLDAFREIQDKGLANQTKGHDATIPVAIFDEFDCKVDAQPMGWLSEFLEPIQDGTFRAGQLSYRVGRSIMIFAGGTCERYKDFRAQAHSEELRDAKTKDFDSRLKGHLDVQGISPLPPKATDPEAHEVAKFRRALTFRSLLRATHPDVIDPLTGRARVDEKVIAAFLDVSVYHHGVRSMESILKMSKQSTNRQSLHKASLPVFSQLDMHVAADEFMRIVHG